MSGDDPGLKIGVAVPTYLRESVLVETLRQLEHQDRPPDEILVVDQTPAHEAATEAYLAERARDGGLRRIPLAAPNLPAARNLALRETGCDVLIFIDDDVELPGDFVSAHLANYARDGVCAVAGRVHQPVPPPPPTRPRGEQASRFDFERVDLSGTARLEPVATFRGCNHSVRVRELLALGGYDEGYIGWAFREDADAAIRLWQAGHVIVFDPEASLTHLARPTGGCRIHTWNPPVPAWMVSYPELRFLRKHFHPRPWYWFSIWTTQVRKYVFTRRTLGKPWRIPAAFAAYLSALRRSARDLRESA